MVPAYNSFMRLVTGFAFALATATLASVCAGQSLGEVARQQRAKKKPATEQRRVITEDELPSSKSKGAAVADSFQTVEAKEPKESPSTAPAKDEKQFAADLQAKIKTQKQKVQKLEAKVRDLQQRLDQRESPNSDIVISQ